MRMTSSVINADIGGCVKLSPSRLNKTQKVDSLIKILRTVAVHTLGDVYDQARSWLEGRQQGIASDIEVQRPHDTTTTIDRNLTWVASESLTTFLQQVSNNEKLSFDANFEMEERQFKLDIEPGEASTWTVNLQVHGDVPSGSKNLTRLIDGVIDNYIRTYFDPLSMSLLGFQLPHLCGSWYVVGAAVDLGSAIIYSGMRLSSGVYESFIGDHNVNDWNFNLGKAKETRVQLLSFMDMKGNQAFYNHVRRSVEKKVKYAEVHIGGVPCVSWNLTRLVQGTYDAIVDVRALSPQCNRYLEPIDCAGLIPFLLGTGCLLTDEKGQPVSGFRYARKPVCLLASYDQNLMEKLIEAIKDSRS